jgi:hypothetical protein
MAIIRPAASAAAISESAARIGEFRVTFPEPPPPVIPHKALGVIG